MKKIRSIGAVALTTLILSACSAGYVSNEQMSVVVTDSSSVTRHDAGDSSHSDQPQDAKTVQEQNDDTTDLDDTANQDGEAASENSNEDINSYDTNTQVEEELTASSTQEVYSQAETLAGEITSQATESSEATEPEEVVAENQSETLHGNSSVATSDEVSEAFVINSEALPPNVDVYEDIAAVLGPEAAEYNYIINDLGEGVYQIEVRQDQAIADENISNLIGLFRYNTTDGSVQKQNTVTGNFETFVQ